MPEGILPASNYKEKIMSERKDVIKMKGNFLTLVGNEVKVGDTAPDFTVLDGDLSPVNLSNFKGKTVVIVSVPSIDTPTCDLETNVRPGPLVCRRRGGKCKVAIRLSRS